MAVIEAQDFSNSLACSIISGKLERINLVLFVPEYIIFLSILTIISAGIILPAATMFKNSNPIDVFLSFSSLINALTSRLINPNLSTKFSTIDFLKSLLDPPDLM